MSYFYSPSTRGFYTQDIHGSNIPTDAVPVTAEEHAALLDAQGTGKVIRPDANGFPVAQDPPPPSHEEQIKAQIAALEAKQTPRRVREAALTTEGMDWLTALDAQITALREQL